MNKKEAKEFDKRYEKFKNNNLPTPFWDDERQTFEYVWYETNDEYPNDNREARVLRVQPCLLEALGRITWNGFYYSYTCGHFTWYKDEEPKYVVGHVHAHNFEEVVRDLYEFPESFSIAKDEEKYFSKQELDYLGNVKKYLLFIGLKDLDTPKVSIKRFRNKRHEKYQDASICAYKNKTIELFLSGKRDFSVYIPDDITVYEGRNDILNCSWKELIVDENKDFKLFVQFYKREIKEYKEIKALYQNKDLNDNDKVIVAYFKILEVI